MAAPGALLPSRRNTRPLLTAREGFQQRRRHLLTAREGASRCAVIDSRIRVSTKRITSNRKNMMVACS